MKTTAPPNTHNTEFLRIKDAVKVYGLSESYWRHGVMNRTIPAYRMGKAVFINKNEIDSMIQSNKI